MSNELSEFLATDSVLFCLLSFIIYYFRWALSTTHYMTVNVLPKNITKLLRSFSWIFFMRLDKRRVDLVKAVKAVKGRTNNCFRRSSGERYDWTSHRTSPDDKSRVFLRERAESVRDDLDASERGIEKWTVHRCTQPIGSKHRSYPLSTSALLLIFFIAPTAKYIPVRSMWKNGNTSYRDSGQESGIVFPLMNTILSNTWRECRRVIQQFVRHKTSVRMKQKKLETKYRRRWRD